MSSVKTTKRDPVTEQNVPVFYLHQSAATLEAALKDRLLNSVMKAKIVKMLDFEEARSIFKDSSLLSSIASTFVANSLSESMKSLEVLEVTEIDLADSMKSLLRHETN